MRKYTIFIKKLIQEIKENGNDDVKEFADWFEKYYCEILEGLTVEDITIAFENIMGLDWIWSMDKFASEYEKHKFDEDDSWIDLSEANSESFRDYKKRLLVELRKRKGDSEFSKIVMDYKKLCEDLKLPYASKHQSLCI